MADRDEEVAELTDANKILTTKLNMKTSECESLKELKTNHEKKLSQKKSALSDLKQLYDETKNEFDDYKQDSETTDKRNKKQIHDLQEQVKKLSKLL